MAQTIFYPIPSTPNSSFRWVEDSFTFEGSIEDTLFSDFREILHEINDGLLCDNKTTNLNFDCQLETEASTSPTDFEVEDILQQIDEEAGYHDSLLTFNTSIQHRRSILTFGIDIQLWHSTWTFSIDIRH